MKGWRTIAFNVANGLVLTVSITEWYEVIPDDYTKLWALGVALANVWLRMVTTTPVGRKQ